MDKDGGLKLSLSPVLYDMHENNTLKLKLNLELKLKLNLKLKLRLNLKLELKLNLTPKLKLGPQLKRS